MYINAFTWQQIDAVSVRQSEYADQSISPNACSTRLTRTHFILCVLQVSQNKHWVQYYNNPDDRSQILYFWHVFDGNLITITRFQILLATFFSLILRCCLFRHILSIQIL